MPPFDLGGSIALSSGDGASLLAEISVASQQAGGGSVVSDVAGGSVATQVVAGSVASRKAGGNGDAEGRLFPLQKKRKLMDNKEYELFEILVNVEKKNRRTSGKVFIISRQNSICFRKDCRFS